MIRHFTLLVFIGLAFWSCEEETIPTEVSLWGEVYSVESTTELDLRNNELTGPIPSEIGYLTNLTYLDLRYNQLTGSIPPELGNLTNLTLLDLRNNELTGSIPSEIGNLTNLTILKLENNQLTGEIPESICDLDLKFWNSINFNVNNNQLCPPYPSCIGVYLGGQDISDCDTLPPGYVNLWDNFYSIENTTSLDLGNIGLTGEIPPEIGNLTNLTHLDLLDNELTGSIPSEIGNLTNLTYLKLSSNQLSGIIPDEICNQGDSSPGLSNNQLCPPYPTCVEDFVGEQDTTNCN